MGGMTLTPTARVVLGMLRLGKRTGYEIKQLVDVSTRFFWAASYGQIYPELKRLEERGLVESEPQPTGGRAPARDPPAGARGGAPRAGGARPAAAPPGGPARGPLAKLLSPGGGDP